MTDTPQSLTITLTEPVTINEGKRDEAVVAELTFRRAKGRDFLMMDKVKGETSKTCAMYASMAGVPFQVFEEMSGDDFQRVMMEVAPLLGNSGKKALDAALAEAAKKAASDA